MIWSPSPKKEAPGPDVQLSALDMGMGLVDSGTVRKLFGVSESSSDRSNTPQGAPPERPEEPLEAKAGGKEGKLPGLEHPSARAPATAQKSPAELLAEIDDKEAVGKASLAWIDTVTSEAQDAPEKTAALYAADGVLWGTEVHAPDDPLWGTVSEEVRDTPEKIYAYYDYFARLPKLRLVEYTPGAVRVHGDFAAVAGTQTFAWRGADGLNVQMRARFSLTFRRDHPERGPDKAWMIMEHFSSSMPTAPAEFKQAAAAALTTAPSSPVVATRGTTDATLLDGVPPSIHGPLPPISSSDFAEPPVAAAGRGGDGDGDGAAAAAQEKRDDDLQIVDDLSEERQVRAKQIVDLQRRADRAESLAAEGAILRASERLAGAREDAELEERALKAHRHAEELAEKAKTLAAELEALLAEEHSESMEGGAVVAGPAEAKPEEQAKASDSRVPEPAKQIEESEESAEAGNAASENSQDVETRA